jgi:hypothetical protein
MPHAYCGDPGLPCHRDPSHGHHCLTHPPPEVSLKGQYQQSTMHHAYCGDPGLARLREPLHDQFKGLLAREYTILMLIVMILVFLAISW